MSGAKTFDAIASNSFASNSSASNSSASSGSVSATIASTPLRPAADYNCILAVEQSPHLPSRRCRGIRGACLWYHLPWVLTFAPPRYPIYLPHFRRGRSRSVPLVSLAVGFDYRAAISELAIYQGDRPIFALALAVLSRRRRRDRLIPIPNSRQLFLLVIKRKGKSCQPRSESPNHSASAPNP